MLPGCVNQTLQGCLIALTFISIFEGEIQTILAYKYTHQRQSMKRNHILTGYT